MNEVTLGFIKVLLFAGVLFVIGYLLMYNKKVIDRLTMSESLLSKIFYKIFGRHLYQLNQRVTRNVNLNKQSVFYTVYKYFDDMLKNLDLADNGVTVIGLLTFIGCIALSCAVVLSYLLNMLPLLPFTFGAIYYVIVVLFRFASLMRYEKREADIMDAVDLLVCDIKGGVYNAIIRYKDSFNPAIRPYFLEFVDDIQGKGYSFEQAMLILNDKLGHNFTEFAQNAIMYEKKADKNMDEIFSPIIETNRQRRTLRHINALAFNKLRSDLIISMLIIVVYAVIAMSMDKYLALILMRSTTGKILIIIDIILIGWVLTYIASIKAKTL